MDAFLLVKYRRHTWNIFLCFYTVCVSHVLYCTSDIVEVLFLHDVAVAAAAVAAGPQRLKTFSCRLPSFYCQTTSCINTDTNISQLIDNLSLIFCGISYHFVKLTPFSWMYCGALVISPQLFYQQFYRHRLIALTNKMPISMQNILRKKCVQNIVFSSLLQKVTFLFISPTSNMTCQRMSGFLRIFQSPWLSVHARTGICTSMWNVWLLNWINWHMCVRNCVDY